MLRLEDRAEPGEGKRGRISLPRRPREPGEPGGDCKTRDPLLLVGCFRKRYPHALQTFA